VQNDTEKRADDNERADEAPEPDKLTAAQQAGEPEPEPEAEAAEASGSADADGTGGEDAGEPEAAEEHDQQPPPVTERADEDEQETEAAEAAAGEQPASTEGAAIAADLDAARAEAETYLDDLRRLQADFDNYRKRTLREQTARATSASQALVAKLLPVLDNFELAVSAAEQSRDFDRMLKGVEMVFGELREVLQGEGLVKIEAEGKPFDPERHEAVIAVEQEDTEPGTVLDIVRTGYELRGKVLRPAMVKVAK
jgi:molecular chaperone GrpE